MLQGVEMRCDAPHCRQERGSSGPRPDRAAPGWRLCWGCRDRLAAQLAELPALYVGLAANLASPAAAYPERVSRSGRPGIPLDAEVVEARADIRGVLAAWADLVVEGRRATPPARAVPSLASFLGRHVDWLAAHPAAGDVAGEIGDLVHAGRRAASPKHTRFIALGTCVKRGCGGTLVACIREGGDQMPSMIACDADDQHTWPPRQWYALARHLRQVL